MAYIIQNQGTPQERVCDLKQGLNTIGRGLDNSIVVEDEARSLSRHHAEIQVSDRGIYVTDLNSSNGTFVNQTKIVQQKLSHGDLVQFGSVVFRLVDDLDHAHPATLQAPTNANSGLSILMRVSPEKSRVNMQDLLQQLCKFLPEL